MNRIDAAFYLEMTASWFGAREKYVSRLITNLKFPLDASCTRRISGGL